MLIEFQGGDLFSNKVTTSITEERYRELVNVVDGKRTRLHTGVRPCNCRTGESQQERIDFKK